MQESMANTGQIPQYSMDTKGPQDPLKVLNWDTLIGEARCATQTSPLFHY